MGQPFLKSGQPHSGSYLFVRSDKNLEDEWLLQALGLQDYHRTDALFDRQRHVVIGNSAGWTVIGDDFEYAKFHGPSAPEALSLLVTSVKEVFLYLHPDTDDSFRFWLWRDGTIDRSYSKDSSGWGRPYTIREIGTSLPAETSALAEDRDRASTISLSLGFDLDEALGTYRVYAGPQYEPLGASGPILTNARRSLVDGPILGPWLRWRTAQDST